MADSPSARSQAKPEAGVRRFLTEGHARWTALAGVLFVVGVAAVVVDNPKEASQLRQQLRDREERWLQPAAVLLLHNSGHRHGAATAIREHLSGSFGTEWGDVRAVSHGSGQALLNSIETTHGVSAVSGRGGRVHLSEGCGRTCDVEGYSLPSAGHSANKACIDVCLEGRGISLAGVAGPLATLEKSAAQPRIGRGGGRGGAMSAAQRLLAKLQRGGAARGHTAGASLASVMHTQGVRPSHLPRADADTLERAEAADASISGKEARVRGALRQSYQGTVRQMRTYQAARLANAADLDKATASAKEHDAARIALDSSLVSAAAKYAAQAGPAAAGGGSLVDTAKATRDLGRARGEMGAEEAARGGAAKLLAEERELWKDSKAVVDRQLAARRWTQPGARVEQAQWAAELRHARGLPVRTAKKVQQADHSQGELAALERAAYRRQRKEAGQMSRELRGLHAARMANAQMELGRC
ncbi:hypothetical protein T484DRAFT_1830981 [Baffinella frigidus]|nr:hypothetical protein T484DRAFT_1830981 [Cryptophyta sp. CCMP2293]